MEEARVSKGVWRTCFRAHQGSWQKVSVSYYVGLSIRLLRTWLPRSGDEGEEEGGEGGEREREKTLKVEATVLL